MVHHLHHHDPNHDDERQQRRRRHFLILGSLLLTAQLGYWVQSAIIPSPNKTSSRRIHPKPTTLEAEALDQDDSSMAATSIIRMEHDDDDPCGEFKSCKCQMQKQPKGEKKSCLLARILTLI